MEEDKKDYSAASSNSGKRITDGPLRTVIDTNARDAASASAKNGGVPKGNKPAVFLGINVECDDAY